MVVTNKPNVAVVEITNEIARKSFRRMGLHHAIDAHHAVDQLRDDA